MIKFQDIQIEDKTLRNNFVEYFLGGQYNKCKNILNNYSQLDNKKFVASVMNQISTILINLCDRITPTIEDELEELLNEFQSLIEEIVYLDTYQSGTKYEKYNFVLYNNYIYMYIDDTPSIYPPTNTDRWLNVGLYGKQGAAGIDVNLRYVWDSTTTYAENDLVAYDTSLWVATQANTGSIPSSSSSDWNIFITTSEAEIATGSSTPTDIFTGQIWFQYT